jgi:hypothetical protein
MIPPVLEEITLQLSKRKSPFVWVRDTPTKEDIESLQKEAFSDSSFDPLKLRSSMLEDVQVGKASIICRRGPFARVVAVVYKDSVINWSLWADIFNAFGPPPPSCGPFWQILFFCNPIVRRFPPPEQQVSAEHINGGYAIPYNSKSIVIYREEEAHRVLVHELLHACGSDNPKLSVELKEAYTETWAELFLIGILAKGSVRKASRLWNKQSHWIANQNFILLSEYNVTNINSYAWRYTVAREEVLKQYGLSLPSPSTNPKDVIHNSLRFTSPDLE